VAESEPAVVFVVVVVGPVVVLATVVVVVVVVGATMQQSSLLQVLPHIGLLLGDCTNRMSQFTTGFSTSPGSQVMVTPCDSFAMLHVVEITVPEQDTPCWYNVVAFFREALARSRLLPMGGALVDSVLLFVVCDSVAIAVCSSDA